jgi:hypothetical protein
MIPQKIKGLIPHVTAIILFIVLSALYFYPQLSGLQLRQGDIVNFIGTSKEIADYREKFHSEPLWTNSMFGGMPAYQISTKNTNYVNDLETKLIHKPLMYPLSYMFLAMLGFYILLVCFGVNPWISIIGAIAFGLSSINILYLAGGHSTKVHAIALIPPLIGSMLLAYRKNLKIGAVLFAFFVCLELTANHLQMTYYALFLVFALIVVELYLHIREKLYAKFAKVSAVLLVAALIGALPTLTNLLTTYEYSKVTTRGKSELTITSNDHSSYKTSDKNALSPVYIKEYNLGPGEVWSMVIPNVKGGSDEPIGNRENIIKEVDDQYKEAIAQQPTYWGEQSFSGGAFYFGASMFVLFILGMVFIKDPIKWAFLAVSLLAIVLSLKDSFILDFFIGHFPLFNKFRDTKMFMYLVQIAFPFIGILFLKEIFAVKIDKKKLVYSLIAINGILFILYLMPSVWFNFLSNNEAAQFGQQIKSIQDNPSYLQQFNTFQYELENARIHIFKNDLIRSLFFTISISLLVYLFVIEKFKKNYLLVSVGLLVLIDIWGVDRRYLNSDKVGSNYKNWVRKAESANPFQVTAADNAILSNELSNNPELRHKITDEVSRYVPAESSRNTDPEMEKSKITFRELNFATNYRVLTLNNPFANSSVSYFHKSIGGYHGAKLKKYQELIDFYLNPEYQLIYNSLRDTTLTNERLLSLLQNGIPALNMLNAKYIIYSPNSSPLINPYAYGSCWFVNNVEQVDNADQEMLALGKNDLKNTAVVNKKDFSKLKKTSIDTTGYIKQTSFIPNHYTYKSKANSDQVAVFSEIYYADGWNAYLDGKKTDYFRADYVLRAMLIPAGEHTIEFKFEPQSFFIGERVSSISSIILILLLIGVLGFEVWTYYKKK